MAATHAQHVRQWAIEFVTRNFSVGTLDNALDAAEQVASFVLGDGSAGDREDIPDITDADAGCRLRVVASA